MATKSLIHYRIQWKPAGNQPGAKRGLSAGVGDQLRALVMLRDHPDPRRLDLGTSMRDPFERLWVRDFYLNTAFKVIVLLDASASMGYVGAVNRMQVAQDIISQIALSAYHSGDPFGLYTANEATIKSAVMPTRLNRSAWLWVKQRLSQLKPSGSSVEGLIKLTAQLPKRRSLVFIVSDFRWPKGQYQQILKQLSHHDVVPMMLQDPAEVDAMPHRGIATVRDSETGQTQFVWMRKSLILRIKAARQAHIDELASISRTYGCKPFVVKGTFESMQLTRYFMERNA